MGGNGENPFGVNRAVLWSDENVFKRDSAGSGLTL